eukprot:CAMPEP_0173401464 /NCGR_PEP_ID=MMETSP1356-20130122/50996_1 /TAXON_ID=77927 ORGANISM="Hemiselmis virescens, Strain PCC157" /NCGR_SAMPLE_ID=MMETSP1356 /ASSEMBLY_ACC=CAM_ASM_000847 /LENGTH=57 /DNA_ID=CAMNT_0014361603 /DNA_START=117 /DNA_END=286 /DNA_ORIENTATION=+
MSNTSPCRGQVSIWYTGRKRINPNTEGVSDVCTRVSLLVAVGFPVSNALEIDAFLAA